MVSHEGRRSGREIFEQTYNSLEAAYGRGSNSDMVVRGIDSKDFRAFETVPNRRTPPSERRHRDVFHPQTRFTKIAIQPNRDSIFSIGWDEMLAIDDHETGYNVDGLYVEGVRPRKLGLGTRRFSAWLAYFPRRIRPFPSSQEEVEKNIRSLANYLNRVG